MQLKIKHSRSLKRDGNLFYKMFYLNTLWDIPDIGPVGLFSSLWPLGAALIIFLPLITAEYFTCDPKKMLEYINITKGVF